MPMHTTAAPANCKEHASPVLACVAPRAKDVALPRVLERLSRRLLRVTPIGPAAGGLASALMTGTDPSWWVSTAATAPPSQLSPTMFRRNGGLRSRCDHDNPDQARTGWQAIA
jgi:hypothetical protein